MAGWGVCRLLGGELIYYTPLSSLSRDCLTVHMFVARHGKQTELGFGSLASQRGRVLTLDYSIIHTGVYPLGSLRGGSALLLTAWGGLLPVLLRLTVGEMMLTFSRERTPLLRNWYSHFVTLSQGCTAW